MPAENSLWRSARLLIRSRKTEEETTAEHEETQTPESEAIEVAEPPVMDRLQVEETAEAEVIEETRPMAVNVEKMETLEEQTIEKAPAPEPPKQRVEPARESEVAGLARLRSDVERERGQRLRAEQRAAALAAQVQALHAQLGENLAAEGANSERISELERELDEARAQAAEFEASVKREQTERHSVEEELAVVRDLNSGLEERAVLFASARETFQKGRGELEEQLKAARAALRQTEMALEEEMKSRQELELTASQAQRERQELESQTRETIARLESELASSELDRKAMEAEILKARAETLQHERAHRAGAQQFRSGLAAPVRRLNESACELLQAGLSDEQKRVVEGMLEEVLAMESTLAEAKE